MTRKIAPMAQSIDGQPATARSIELQAALIEILERPEFQHMGFYVYVSDGPVSVVLHDGDKNTLEYSNIRAYVEYMKHYGPHAPQERQ